MISLSALLLGISGDVVAQACTGWRIEAGDISPALVTASPDWEGGSWTYGAEALWSPGNNVVGSARYLWSESAQNLRATAAYEVRAGHLSVCPVVGIDRQFGNQGTFQNSEGTTGTATSSAWSFPVGLAAGLVHEVSSTTDIILFAHPYLQHVRSHLDFDPALNHPNQVAHSTSFTLRIGAGLELHNLLIGWERGISKDADRRDFFRVAWAPSF